MSIPFKNMLRRSFSLLFWLFIAIFLPAQKKQLYKTAIIAFYNCENFYDTIDDPLSRDEEFTPLGEKHYTQKMYADKLEKIATVISQIGTGGIAANPYGASIIGLSEIENKTVLKDIINHSSLKKRNYQIIHYDSKDERGIDVALLYNPAYFTVEQSKPLFIKMRGYYYSRDILWVKGKLDGETVHIYVNHWPARTDAEDQNESARIVAATVLRNHIDSIYKADGAQKIIIMGDFNDNPDNKSITEILKAKPQEKKVTKFGLYNPFAGLYNHGIGSIISRDVWSLFDQIIISYPWLNKNQNNFFFYRPQIFNPTYLTENMGRYKGYPMRTWDGNNYRGGYSDHFPSYIVLLKKAGMF